jgi:hypothetical protein
MQFTTDVSDDSHEAPRFILFSGRIGNLDCVKRIGQLSYVATKDILEKSKQYLI